MIVVVGASGHLGRATVQLLLQGGHRVRAVARYTEPMAALAAAGAELARADLTDAASLLAACHGANAVFTAAHGLLGRGRYRSEAVDDQGHRSLIAAARAAGAQRFVYTSVLGASPDHPLDFWRTKWQIEQALAASGLPHVVLRPSAFMEQHVHEFNGQRLLQKGKAQLIGPGTKPRNFVAVHDVARLAVRALTDAQLVGRTLEIGGPGNLGNLAVSETYARLAGLPLKVGHLPAAVAGALGTLIAPLHPGVARVLRLASLPDDAFDERFDAARLPPEVDWPLTAVEDFVRQRVAAAA